MCGLAGFIGPGDRDDLDRMVGALTHRGPDAEGYFVDESSGIYIGHRRLAIVDIPSGSQPMWSEDRQVAVVFNGEIYNHLALRAELLDRGHAFATNHCDTEVLVHGWEQWGEDLPSKLNGMFAFAVVDLRKRRIFLARDRFGEKPLYYMLKDGFLAFASELSSLAQHPSVSRSISPRALQKFFAYGYIPAPHSFLERTAKLPGGCWLRFDLLSGEATVKQYWKFLITTDPSIRDEDEPKLIEECDALLRQAANRRLMSDVPLGVFLSGGLDSSLVVSMLSRVLNPKDISSFTIGFDERTFDESTYARAVADHIGSAHETRFLTLSYARDLLPYVLARMDEPLGDPSILPTYLVSSFAREKVKVVLTGDVGDELFAGYDPFLALGPAEMYSRWVPRNLHRLNCRLVDLLPRSHANMSLDFKLRRTLMGLSWPESMRLPIWMSPVDPKDQADLLTSPVQVEVIYDEAISAWTEDQKKPTADRALEFFTRFYLQDDILTKVDRASMLCSLEARAVFLDNDLAEFCCRLPSRFKLRNGTRKYLLKKVAERYLPKRIIQRKKKGFGIPIAKWLRDTGPIIPFASVAGLKPPFLQAASESHRAGHRDHRMLLWCWLALQYWKAPSIESQSTAESAYATH